MKMILLLAVIFAVSIAGGAEAYIISTSVDGSDFQKWGQTGDGRVEVKLHSVCLEVAGEAAEDSKAIVQYKLPKLGFVPGKAQLLVDVVLAGSGQTGFTIFVSRAGQEKPIAGEIVESGCRQVKVTLDPTEAVNDLLVTLVLTKGTSQVKKLVLIRSSS